MPARPHPSDCCKAAADSSHPHASVAQADLSLGDGGTSDRIQGCGSINTNGRRTSLTLVAHLQEPRRLPHHTTFIQHSADAIDLERASSLALPDDRARSRPAITRSPIIARSNSLDTERGVDGKRLWKLEDMHSGRVSWGLCLTTRRDEDDWLLAWRMAEAC